MNFDVSWHEMVINLDRIIREKLRRNLLKAIGSGLKIETVCDGTEMELICMPIKIGINLR